MEFPPELEVVEGAKNLRDWFGYWPSFHDAEVIQTPPLPKFFLLR